MPVAALIVEDGTGLEDADAYCDVDFVRSYFEDRGDAVFASETDTILTTCIRRATQFFDIEWGPRANGVPTNLLQSLVFPLDEEALPPKLLQAIAELAKLAFAGPLAGVGAAVQSPSSASVKRLKAGSVEIEYGDIVKDRIETDAADRFYLIEKLAASFLGAKTINGGSSR
jgi:hypothetical protein